MHIFFSIQNALAENSTACYELSSDTNLATSKKKVQAMMAKDWEIFRENMLEIIDTATNLEPHEKANLKNLINNEINISKDKSIREVEKHFHRPTKIVSSPQQRCDKSLQKLLEAQEVLKTELRNSMLYVPYVLDGNVPAMEVLISMDGIDERPLVNGLWSYIRTTTDNALKSYDFLPFEMKAFKSVKYHLEEDTIRQIPRRSQYDIYEYQTFLEENIRLYYEKMTKV